MPRKKSPHTPINVCPITVESERRRESRKHYGLILCEKLRSAGNTFQPTEENCDESPLAIIMNDKQPAT